MQKQKSPPVLILVCGYLGTGKTTTARKLARLLQIPRASIDEILLRVFSKLSNFKKDQPFNKDEIAANYRIFELLADYLLSASSSLILDGSFATRRQRDRLIMIAKRRHAKSFILQVSCPDKIARERAIKRFRLGQGVGWNAHLAYKRRFEPIKGNFFSVDTSRPVSSQLLSFIKKNRLNQKQHAAHRR